MVPGILVVDDHPDIRRLLTAALGGSYRIFEADSGQAAIEALHQHRPDLVLLDIMMPGEVDGMQVLDTIRKLPQTRNTLVAMISARGQVDDLNLADRRGADAYFVKPFSPMQVVNWVRQQLGVR